ncbi:hypothetical protein EVAR_7759_1 [Eumeta japonica]|uniref:Uncharacterized protein n=1 Tax=Eumeta variegata TaxID=151549 RepID=A0A4C1TJV9_EUMVA|nr:hypothetical protein EVAR_7759_1 [Eumeta japonica]
MTIVSYRNRLFKRINPGSVQIGTVTDNGMEIAYETRSEIESRDWGELEVENGIKNVINRSIKIRVNVGTGTETRREQN